MTRTITTTIAACAGALLLSLGTVTAQAEYTGYGNGDPGGWDFATEQAGGPCGMPGGRAIDPSTGEAACCAKYNPTSACPLAHAPTHLYRSELHRKHRPS